MSIVKPESMEDILREYERDLEDMEKRCLWHPTDAYLRKLLERVSGAWKRERVEIATRAATQAVNLTNEKIANSPAGNAAEQRKALESVVEIADREWRSFRETPAMKEMRDVCTSALSAPPRNCDVGTAEEQEERYLKLKREHVDRMARCPAVGQSSFFPDSLYWAQMPYEAKEGGKA